MLEQGVREILTGDSVINGQTGGRIRPLVGAQLDARPLMLFSVTAGETTSTMTGSSATDYKKSNVEIAIYADTYLACAILSGESRRVFDGKGTTTSTERIVSFLDEESDVEQAFIPGQPVPVYLRTQQYRCLHRSI